MYLTVTHNSTGTDKESVTVLTPPNTTVVVNGESRESMGFASFEIPYSNIVQEAGRDVIHVDATRGGDHRTEILWINKQSANGTRSSSSSGSGSKFGVAVLGGSPGSDLKVKSPFGNTSIGGDPIVIAFSVDAGTKLTIGGTAVEVANGKAAYAMPLDQLVATAPIGAVFPSNFMHPKLDLLVEVTTPDGQKHTEELSLEASTSFGPVAQHIFDPTRSGTPVDLGPSPAGGFILLNPSVSGFRPRIGGRLSTLKDVTVAVWQTNLPDKSAGNCSYLSPSRGRISVPAYYGAVELAAYDLRKGKLKKKQVLRGSGSRCPTVITSYGGVASAGHSVSQAQVDSALTKLLK